MDPYKKAEKEITSEELQYLLNEKYILHHGLNEVYS
jgi:hypothetical protein